MENDRISPHLIRVQLARMLRSEVFRPRRTSSHLLRFFVEESLRSGFGPISQRALAVHALGLADDFTPQKSAHVRVAVARLRDALEAFYETHGADNEVVFEVSSGPYRLGAKAVAAVHRPRVASGPARPAKVPSREDLPALLVMQPNCDGRSPTLEHDVGLRLMSDLVFSTVTTASGPLRRDSLPKNCQPAEFAAALGFDYVADTSIHVADGRGPRARIEIMATDGSGLVLAAETEWPDLTDGDHASREIATWLCHRIGTALKPLAEMADDRDHGQHEEAADDRADFDGAAT